MQSGTPSSSPKPSTPAVPQRPIEVAGAPGRGPSMGTGTGTATAMASPNITVRRLAPSDSVTELTSLLHRAYAKQVEMGLAPLAGRQDDGTTRQRVFSGECYVAVDHQSLPDEDCPTGTGLAVETRQRLVGCILFHEIEDSKGPPWFEQKHVASFSQFAVDPTYQGAGIGQMLLDLCERRAKEDNATELALSMAEPDQDLLLYYLRRGYRFIEHWKWPYTNYRSAILSKAL